MLSKIATCFGGEDKPVFTPIYIPTLTLSGLKAQVCIYPTFTSVTVKVPPLCSRSYRKAPLTQPHATRANCRAQTRNMAETTTSVSAQKLKPKPYGRNLWRKTPIHSNHAVLTTTASFSHSFTRTVPRSAPETTGKATWTSSAPSTWRHSRSSRFRTSRAASTPSKRSKVWLRRSRKKWEKKCSRVRVLAVSLFIDKAQGYEGFVTVSFFYSL